MIRQNQPQEIPPAADTGERISRPLLRQIEAVKEGARIEEVAGYYGQFKLAGDGRLVGRCLSPEHEDRTPSMYVYTDDPHFHCFGCGESGDVVDLVRLVEGCEFWEAMMILSSRYGISLPERPRSWFDRQERQAPVRDAIEETKLRLVQRRLFRIFLPLIEAIEDPEERREEIEILWGDTRRIAALVVAGRTS